MPNTPKPSNLSFTQTIQLNDAVVLKKNFLKKKLYKGYLCIVEDFIQSSDGKVL